MTIYGTETSSSRPMVWKKYQLIRQHSEEDCGAACIATIAKHYGRNFTIARVREMVGTGQVGTSLLGLRRGAEALGFNARQVKANSQSRIISDQG